MPRNGRCNESEHKGVGEVLLDEQAAHRTGTRGNRENNRPAVIGGANRRTYLEENVAVADIVLSTAELAALDEVAPTSSLD